VKESRRDPMEGRKGSSQRVQWWERKSTVARVGMGLVNKKEKKKEKKEKRRSRRSKAVTRDQILRKGRGGPQLSLKTRTGARGKTGTGRQTREVPH